MQKFIAGLCLLGAFFVGIIGALFGYNLNKRGVPCDKDSARGIDNGLEQSKVGLEHGKERIDAGAESIDFSIDRLKSALEQLKSIEKRNNDLQGK